MSQPDYEFTTDGCSGGIYRTIFRREPPWRGCCVEHDALYWVGGTRSGRRSADIELMRCVAANGHPWVAMAMYAGVRLGGHPLLPLPWRWGYGWRYPRWYEPERPCDVAGCGQPSVVMLDGDRLCKTHADAWVRGEGAAYSGRPLLDDPGF